MEDKIKRLGVIKQKIRRLEQRLNRHGDELSKLKAERDSLEREINPSGTISNNITQTVCDILKSSKIQMFPTEILGKMEADGFKFGVVKDPYVVVFATCARLAKNNLISSNKIKNKRAFFIK